MFKDDLPHGRGVLKSADGTVYEGEFANGRRTGYGVLTKPDGTRYQGTFVNDALQSQ